MAARQCLFTVRWHDGDDKGAREEVQLDRLCLRAGTDGAAPAPGAESPSARCLAAKPAPPKTSGPAASLLADPRCGAAVCHFFEWCALREEGHMARRAGRPAPWCRHPLMAGHHFCNVSRLDDRGTAAFHAFVRTQGVTSLAGVLWCSLVYRRLNRLSTFADWQGRLPLPHEAAPWLDWLTTRCADPHAPSVFTCKHQQSGGLAGYVQMVRGLAGLDAPASPGFPHVRSVAHALQDCTCAAEAHATLKAHLRHVGDFIAWQVLCDLVESGHLEQAATDDWVALGPGARAGLNLIFGQTSGAGGEAVMGRLRALQAAQPWAMAFLGRPTTGILAAEEGAHPLLLRDLEHSLCEFAKWFALRRGWTSPGPYTGADRTHHLPLLPQMRVERRRDGAFRVTAPPEAGGHTIAAGPATCAAFPPQVPGHGVRAAEHQEPPPLPPWLPRERGVCSRKRPRREVADPSAARPERAALLLWFDAFWLDALAAGWRVVTKTRHAGATAGSCDSYWLSPSGRRFRSRAEVAASQGFVGDAGPAADAPQTTGPGDSERADKKEQRLTRSRAQHAI